MSTRDKIKSAQDRPEEIVEVPEWGVSLRVRGMSAADVIALSQLDQGGTAHTQQMLSGCIFDESGERVYPTAADAAELLEKSMPIVHRVLQAAKRVNGILPQEKKGLRAVANSPTA